MKKLLMVACITALAVVSCKKDNTETMPNTICTTAKVHYGGDPAADGTGWVLVTDTISGKFEVADNLDSSFKTEGAAVDICYMVTDVDFVCFCTPPSRKKIHLTSIRMH